jgi:hypothetical protein
MAKVCGKEDTKMIENAKYFHDASVIVAESIVTNGVASGIINIDQKIEMNKNLGLFSCAHELYDNHAKAIAKALKTYYKKKGFKCKILSNGYYCNSYVVRISWKNPKNRK